jgi:hypothetical protein
MPSNPELSKYIKNRFSFLKDQRKPWEDEWTELADLVMPTRRFDTNYHDQRNADRGDPITDNVHSSWAMYANRLMADGFLGQVVSPGNPWFKSFIDRTPQMITEKFYPNEIHNVRMWLDERDSVIYSELERSNYYSEMHMAFMDAGWCGTVVQTVEEDLDNNVLNFQTQHIMEYYIRENAYGKIDTAYRLYYISARDMNERWSKTDLSKQVQQAIDKEEWDKAFPVIHAIEPRNNVKGLPEKQLGKIDKINKNYSSIYIEPDSRDSVLEVSGRDAPPVVWRWVTMAGEHYGRGPASWAKNEIVALNNMTRDMLVRSQKEVDPPMIVDDSFYGNFSTNPGVINFFNGLSTKRVAEPVPLGGNFSIGTAERQLKMDSISKHFHNDFFAILQSMGEAKTAEEVRAIQNEQAILLAPVTGRLEQDFLDGQLDRISNILQKAGKLPAVPQELEGWEGTPIRINYLGALPQLQRRMRLTAGLGAFKASLGAVAQLQQMGAQVPESIMQNFDFDEIIRMEADAYNLPARASRPKDMVFEERVQRQRMALEMQQAEAAKQAARAHKDLAVAPEEGSPAEAIEG